MKILAIITIILIVLIIMYYVLPIMIKPSSYVIIGRNGKNDRFKIIEKNIFIILKDDIGFIVSESDIVKDIEEGIEYYTYNEELNTFTEVIVVNSHIKTIKNDTKIDNIDNLPIIED